MVRLLIVDSLGNFKWMCRDCCWVQYFCGSIKSRGNVILISVASAFYVLSFSVFVFDGCNFICFLASFYLILQMDLSNIQLYCSDVLYCVISMRRFLFSLCRKVLAFNILSAHVITIGFLLSKGMELPADTKHQSFPFLSAKIFCSRLSQSKIGYSTKYLYRLFGLLPL